MAFEVTPTSGDSPYTFTADFLRKDSFNYGYSLRFRLSAQTPGICPLPSETPNMRPEAASALIDYGVYIRSGNSVPAGSCQLFKLEVLDSLGNIIDMKYVTVSNI